MGGLGARCTSGVTDDSLASLFTTSLSFTFDRKMYRQLTSSISSFLLNSISPFFEISIHLLVLPTLQISNTIPAPATLASPHVCALRGLGPEDQNGGASTSS